MCKAMHMLGGETCALVQQLTRAKLCTCYTTTTVTLTVLPCRRSTVISPAASSSRSARYFMKRFTPAFSSLFRQRKRQAFRFPRSI